ncbi:DUF3093 domain-containing protein [Kineosporia rhizophila]|uniref:DUF3093 domain-containing protein n=1 Tax=Kineosporia TaxID=49184 RepID=UPI001E2BDCD0|nr:MULTISPECIES: DUF3093 domain-containing protein [Kineosporia]MCE0537332.1 DUF3093 domain-containing protein [Kineosporia rhizophila]GLY17522.1 hypothetical protein Kisp01_45360 [Kineosporia sp. NBRC 101677]
MRPDQQEAAASATPATTAKKKNLTEKLSPTPGVWLGFAAFGAAFGLIPGPINVPFAIGTAVVMAGVVLGLVVLWTPRLELAKGVFSAGRAKVPASLVAEVEALDPARMKALLGTELDARAYRCTRGWVRTGIRVTLDDPQDPTPYWLVSTRRPQDWVRALGS